MPKILTQVFASLRLRLFLLVLLVCAPLAGMILYSAWDGRRGQLESWKNRARAMMQLAAREESRLIGQTRQLLLAMAESSQVRSGNRRDSKKLLDDLIGSYPRYANLGVVSTNGELIASALAPAETTPVSESARGAERLVAKTPNLLGPTSDSQFDPLLFQRVLQTRAFAVGDFPVGRTNGRPVIDFAYPVFDLTGQVQAVVTASLDLDWVSRFESELLAQLPPGATWTELARDGVILTRHPSPEKWFGQPFPERSMLKAILGEPQGIIESENASGLDVIHAFSLRRSQFIPAGVVSVLGISRDELFSVVDRVLFRNLAGLGISAALALFLGWFGSNVLVLSPVKALAKSSARLAAGDLTARTGLRHGPDELGQLTRTFDQMAQALEHHELERERARQKLQILSRRLVTAQENERRHIARELHDQIGQALTVAQLNLQAAMETANGRLRTSRLKDCLDVVENTLEQVHDLSLNLRPSMLDDLGLEPALRWLTERQASLGGLRFEVNAHNISGSMDQVVKTECFRVAQEALTNIIRHSKASSVVLDLHNDGEHLHLRVRDDGVGFDVNAVRDQAVRGASLGLLSMEERASLAGGGLEFISAPGKGTEVHAWFPTRMPMPKAFVETDDILNEDDLRHTG